MVNSMKKKLERKQIEKKMLFFDLKVGQ